VTCCEGSGADGERPIANIGNLVFRDAIHEGGSSLKVIDKRYNMGEEKLSKKSKKKWPEKPGHLVTTHR
jgi:hypothetical protein